MTVAADSAVAKFLAALDSDRREGFLNYVDHTYSIYEIWLYATVLGYDGSFTLLEKWVQANYRKLNRRELLLGEVCKLEADIDFLRQQVQADLIKADAAASRIAHLSKELRGHVSEVERMNRTTDRRGLVLAGADKVLRELKTIFRGNDEILAAMEIAGESIWKTINEEG